MKSTTNSLRLLILATLGGTGLLAHAEGAKKPLVNLPPTAELHYQIKAKQSGLPLGGSASVTWRIDDAGKYSISTETRAMIVGKILDANSQGRIDEHGLAPERFTEKRLGKPATVTSFEREGKIIRFSASSETYPIKGGEQDRTSATWQLIALARAAGEQFVPGSEWKMFVAGRRDAENWSFKVLQSETIHTALGDLMTVHLLKAPPPDSKDQQLELWLAPGVEYYPVRLRFSDADGDFVDQTITQIIR